MNYVTHINYDINWGMLWLWSWLEWLHIRTIFIGDIHLPFCMFLAYQKNAAKLTLVASPTTFSHSLYPKAWSWWGRNKDACPTSKCYIMCLVSLNVQSVATNVLPSPSLSVSLSAPFSLSFLCCSLWNPFICHRHSLTQHKLLLGGFLFIFLFVFWMPGWRVSWQQWGNYVSLYRNRRPQLSLVFPVHVFNVSRLVIKSIAARCKKDSSSLRLILKGCFPTHSQQSNSCSWGVLKGKGWLYTIAFALLHTCPLVHKPSKCSWGQETACSAL